MTQSLRIASTNQFYIDIVYIFSRKPSERQRAGGIVFFDFSFRFGRRQTLRKMGCYILIAFFYYYIVGGARLTPRRKTGGFKVGGKRSCGERHVGVHLYKRKQGVCLFYYMGSGRIFRCKRSDEVWGVNGVTAGIWSLGA